MSDMQQSRATLFAQLQATVNFPLCKLSPNKHGFY